ncbi:hypothetical protein [Streptomyces celluloflavus]|uniref:hypothetical protein n=1 Tax=Streptomyces celluloflavus TaxID=58344 RepID=UPI0036B3749A
MLWWEADLYDQLQIIQILARLAELGVPAQRITLICIRRAREHRPLRWSRQAACRIVAELSATHACARLPPVAVQFATRAWAAFRSPATDGLRAIVSNRSSELRVPGGAFDRLRREYPAVRDGLSPSEWRIPAAVSDGATDAESAFARVTARETRPSLGDSWCFAMTDRMAHAPVPLLQAEPSDRPVGIGTGLRPTDTEARVFADTTLNGIDRWIGGVHLRGRHLPWRWDDGTENLARPTEETRKPPHAPPSVTAAGPGAAAGPGVRDIVPRRMGCGLSACQP